MCRVVFALILVTTLAAGASAQTGKHVSLGAGIGFHKYVDDEQFNSKNPSIAILYRLSLNPDKPRADGWKLEPSGSIGWSRANTDMVIGGTETRLGRLRSIPVMIGGGPSYRRGPTKVGFSLVAGPAFNKFTVDDDARAAYVGLGQTLNSVETKNALAAKLGVSTWHDLNSRFGLHASLGYLYHRPDTETTVNGVTTSEEWKTDKVKFTAGFAVGIF